MEEVKKQDEKYKKQLFSILILLFLIISTCTAIAIGSVTITISELLALLLKPLPDYIYGGEITTVKKEILLSIRLPRVLLAGAVGSSLAVAGATFQGLFRNPMADPYVIGVSSGAALGAVISMVVGITYTFAGFGTVPFFAFLGGLASILFVYQMARVGKEVPVMTLLLAGIAISSFFSALVSLSTYFAGEELHQVVFWMMGGLGGASWQEVQVMVPYVLAGFCCIYLFARDLNAMLLGEETAKHLGIDTEKMKKILLVGSSLLVAAAVSTSGIIGFVGLVVPHFVRLVAGPDHRFLLPASALCGAALLILTDTLSRTVLAPRELPVGIITALLGAPLFIYLLKRRKNLQYFSSKE